MVGRKGGASPVTLAERSSSRYLVTLLSLLILMITIQLYVWMCTSLTKRVDEIFDASLKWQSQLALDFDKLGASTDATGREPGKGRGGTQLAGC